MNKKLVSVIMPTYNTATYIGEAIESILKQTYSNWELIIVDDDSDDGTVEIINDYIQRDNRIKLIHGKKQKIGGALNLGIETARGEYIARMDADDISLPLRFEKQIEYMEQNKNVGVCATQYQCFSHNKVYEEPICKLFSDQDIKAGLLFYCVIGHPTVMFRRTIFDDGWRYKENSIVEDYDMWTRMIPDVTFACMREVLLLYRQENQNNTVLLGTGRLTEAVNQIIRSCLIRLFDVQPVSYCENVYGTYDRYHQKIDVCKYLENQLELLNQIDNKNIKNNKIFVPSLRKSIQEKWKSTFDFLIIPKEVLVKNDALFINSLDALFDKSKRVNDYIDKLVQIRNYFIDEIRLFKNIVFYGAGKAGVKIFRKYLELKDQGKITCKLDAIVDKSVRNIEINGENYSVRDPQCLKQMKSDVFLITTVNYYDEIKHELIDMGIDSQNIVNAEILWFV